MISFDLRCAHDHVFEAWFRSSADFSEQGARGLLICPICGDIDIAKAVMAPNVAAKATQRGMDAADRGAADRSAAERGAAPAVSPPAGLPAIAAAMMPNLPAEVQPMLAALAKAQADALKQSTWVGKRFAEEARILHDRAETHGAPVPAIHGEATPEEAAALIDDGVAIMPLLVPVVPPALKN